MAHQVKTGKIATQVIPSDHGSILCKYHEADPALIQKAIEGALKARATWEALPWNDR